MRCARAVSSPSPNGVPYHVYKGVWKYLWKLMVIVWKKGTIPRMWCRAGGILIPKEKIAVNTGQLRPISLFNVEGKIFFSVVARRLVSYLKANSLIDISVQKAGIPGFSECLEQSSMI